jgi:hypothetical protein
VMSLFRLFFKSQLIFQAPLAQSGIGFCARFSSSVLLPHIPARDADSERSQFILPRSRDPSGPFHRTYQSWQICILAEKICEFNYSISIGGLIPPLVLPLRCYRQIHCRFLSLPAGHLKFLSSDLRNQPLKIQLVIDINGRSRS